MNPTDPDLRRAIEFLQSHQVIELAEFQVVGGYMRSDKTVIDTLRSFCDRVSRHLEAAHGGLKTFLVWGPSGSGKSGLVQELGAVLREKQVVSLLTPINLSRVRSREEFREALGPIRIAQEGSRTWQSILCWVDEIGAKSDQTWPYEELLPCLPDEKSETRTVFILTGSGMATDTLDSFEASMKGRSFGTDVLTRTSPERCVVPVMDAVDRIVIACSVVARTLRRKLPTVEGGFSIDGLALLYFASSPELRSARELSDRVVKTVERTLQEKSALGVRVRYDDIFERGSPGRTAFLNVLQGTPELEQLKAPIRVTAPQDLLLSPEAAWSKGSAGGESAFERRGRRVPQPPSIKQRVIKNLRGPRSDDSPMTDLEYVDGTGRHYDLYAKMQSEARRTYYAFWTHEWTPKPDYWRRENDGLVERARDPKYDRFVARRIISRQIFDKYRQDVQEHIDLLRQAMDWGIYEVRIVNDLQHFEMMLTDHTPATGRPGYRALLTVDREEPRSIFYDVERDQSKAFADVGPALSEVFDHMWKTGEVPSDLRSGLIREDQDPWKSEVAVGGYFDQVDQNPKGSLREYEERELKALLQSVRDLAKRASKSVDVCEMGSGTGRVLRALAQEECVNWAVGVDYSSEMRKRSEKFLADAKTAGDQGLTPAIVRKITNVTASFTELERIRGQLPSGFGVGRPVLICCVLNTLGVLRSGIERLAVLEAMAALGGDGSEVFVSVWNGENFAQNYKRVYAGLGDLVGDESGWTVKESSRNFTNRRNYFSHWFEQGEITRLVRVSGYKYTSVSRLGDVGFAVTATAGLPGS